MARMTDDNLSRRVGQKEEKRRLSSYGLLVHNLHYEE
jgi:hypothetical protein